MRLLLHFVFISNNYVGISPTALGMLIFRKIIFFNKHSLSITNKNFHFSKTANFGQNRSVLAHFIPSTADGG